MTVFAEIGEPPYEKAIKLVSDWRWKDVIAEIPGAKWRNNISAWTLPLTWSSCLALRTSVGAELTLGPGLIEWAGTLRRDKIDRCNSLRELLDWEGDPGLYGWQRSGIEYIVSGERVLIADAMGAGKTATTIRGLAEISARGNQVFPILVVCPNSVKTSWKREFEQWWPGVKANVIKGTAVQRRKLLEEKAHVYIMNFEAAKSHSSLEAYGSLAMTRCTEHGGEDPKISAARCQVHKKELNNIDFNAVIVDEAHRIAVGKSAQTRAIKKAAGDARFRIALTGTPMRNDITDLWSILNFLDPVEFPAKTKWIGRYVEYMLDGYGGMVVMGIKAAMRPEFEAATDWRIRRMQEDVVLSHLPPIIYDRREVELSAKQLKAYRDLRDRTQAELVDEVGGATMLMPDSPMTKATRLIQLASSYGEVENISFVDEHGFPKIKQKLHLSDPSGKLDAFMSDIDGGDFEGHQVAVMTVSRQLLEMLSARLDKKKIKHGIISGAVNEGDRQQAIDDFQAGRTQFILFTAAAGGTGVTLTAARYLVRLQLPFSLVDFEQSLRRVRRIGSERHENIRVIDYVVPRTLDERAFEVLQVKQESFEDFIRDREQLVRILGDEAKTK